MVSGPGDFSQYDKIENQSKVFENKSHKSTDLSSSSNKVTELILPILELPKSLPHEASQKKTKAEQLFLPEIQKGKSLPEKTSSSSLHSLATDSLEKENSGKKERSPPEKTSSLSLHSLTTDSTDSMSDSLADDSVLGIDMVAQSNIPRYLLPIHGRSSLELSSPDIDRMSGLTTRDSVEPVYQVDVSPLGDDDWLYNSLEICERDFGDGHLVRMVGHEARGGVSGSYFIQNEEGVNQSIFKPLDEELGQINAIRSRERAVQAKPGIEPGTSGLREVVAHRLFPEVVPSTALVSVTSNAFNFSGRENPVKQGSMQEIVPNVAGISSFEVLKSPELQPSMTSIAMVDLCLFNTDRTVGNLLRQRQGESFGLVPIDHGCIAPDNCLEGGRFCWYSSLDPETMFSPEQQEEILSIDLEHSREEFENLGLSRASMNTHTLGVLLTQRLCRDVPIREIAMYEIDRPIEDAGFFSADKSLAYSMLRMAALKGDESLNFEEEDLEAVDFGSVDRENIEEVLDEVCGFIEEQKAEVELNLRNLGISGEVSREILETTKDSSQQIHLVHRCTRNVLYRALIDGNTQDLLSGRWKELAKIEIQKTLSKRLNEN